MKISPPENGKMRKDLREEFFWTLEYCALKRKSSAWRYVVIRIRWRCRTGAGLDLECSLHEFCRGRFHSCGSGISRCLVQTVPQACASRHYPYRHWKLLHRAGRSGKLRSALNAIDAHRLVEYHCFVLKTQVNPLREPR